MYITLGVTGPLCSGKGYVAKRLSSYGFSNFTISDEIRVEASLRNIADERSILQDIGDEMRLLHGSHYWARRIAQQVDRQRAQGLAYSAVIDGLRHPAEVDLLRQKYPGIHIIGVNARPHIRFQRVLDRARPLDPQTRKEFDLLERRDRGIGQANHGQQVDACLRLADVVINNNGGVEALDTQLRKTLKKWGIQISPLSKEQE